ncbi:MAG: PD40 domain-containing protein [Bacteroidetes bacterium]|nr:PD40 domain-containing protein [Bacteroidota bacterium]
MKRYLSGFLIIIFVFISFNVKSNNCYSLVNSKELKPNFVVSQMGGDLDFKIKFYEAIDLFNFDYFDQALPIFLQLLALDKNNCNVNFYVGVCYLKSSLKRTLAIPYLEKAIKKTDAAYSYTHKEIASPVFSYQYLGEAYHANFQFDEALKNYEIFKSFLTDKSRDANFMLEIDRNIEVTKFAKELYAKPLKNVEIIPMKIANSDFSDYTPCFSPSKTMMYFTSKRKGGSGNIQAPEGGIADDIYYLEFKNNKWIKPKKLGSKICGGDIDVLNQISFDGNQLYFTRANKGYMDIFYCVLGAKNKWSQPKKLSPIINTKDNEKGAFMTQDGNTLYFVSDRLGGYGGYDIYISERKSNGEWGQPRNLGQEVNSQYDEDFPYVLPDGVTLYFSSLGHNSMGGYDIFTSTLSENGKWSKPDNIGYPINTPFDDVSFSISVDGKKGYYASGKQGGYGELDIYEINFTGVK